MNDLTSPETEVEGLLRSFFRSEMPESWPIMQPPRSARPAPRRWWGRHGGRLALAASIGFLFLGYLALASRFPLPAPQGDSMDIVGPNIGHKPTHHRAPRPVLLDTRGGAKALLWEQNLGEGEELLLMQEIAAPKSKR